MVCGLLPAASAVWVEAFEPCILHYTSQACSTQYQAPFSGTLQKRWQCGDSVLHVPGAKPRKHHAVAAVVLDGVVQIIAACRHDSAPGRHDSV